MILATEGPTMSYDPVIHPRSASGSPRKEKKKLIFTYHQTPPHPEVAGTNNTSNL